MVRRRTRPSQARLRQTSHRWRRVRFHATRHHVTFHEAWRGRPPAVWHQQTTTRRRHGASASYRIPRVCMDSGLRPKGHVSVASRRDCARRVCLSEAAGRLLTRQATGSRGGRGSSAAVRGRGWATSGAGGWAKQSWMNRGPAAGGTVRHVAAPLQGDALSLSTNRRSERLVGARASSSVR